MNKRQRERFQRLINFLKELDPRKFDLTYIVHARGEYPQTSNDWEKIMGEVCNAKHSCGTTGCVMGWMPVALPRLLRYNRNGDPVTLKTGKAFHEAVEEVFGIPSEASDYLFYDDVYHPNKRSLSYVVKRLERFLEKGVPFKYSNYYSDTKSTRYATPVYYNDIAQEVNIKATRQAHRELQKKLGFAK